MGSRYLFSTARPILLDGRREAGRLARMLYVRFGLESQWFGTKGHILLSIYGRKHPSLPYDEKNDSVNLRLLKSFARERSTATGILALIPCSPEAELFLGRVGHKLEEDFVLLERPESGKNPLQKLVQTNDTKESS